MDIGKLNKRIEIQKFSGAKTNDNGFDEDQYREFKTVWASINNLFGKEYWSAKATQQENTVEFVIRYSKEMEVLNSKEYRIYWNNKKYNITFIDNFKYENKWLKIKAIQEN